jgi:dihydrofolate reductase
MKRIRYSVATSLDGFIAGPRGEFDWIVQDPEVDFGALYRQFDTMLVGRKTFELMAAQGEAGRVPGVRTVVVSRTLRPEDHPDVTVVAEPTREMLARLKEEPGKDIWLMGGASLFGSLLALGMIDTVEVAIIPVVLGDGIPLVPPPLRQAKLRLTSHRVYPTTGIVSLEYAIA